MYSDHQFHKAVAIVFPVPNLAHLVPDAHCTLIYLGNLGENVTFTKDQVLDVLHDLNVLWGRLDAVRVKTDGYDVFGANRDVPVIRLDSIGLRGMRHYADVELERRWGIKSPSEYDYQPHVSLSQMPHQAPPNSLELRRPVLWWGDER